MNKFSILAKSIIISISMVGAANAYDHQWTGFYAGLDAGLAFNNAQLQSQQLGFTNASETCNTSSNYSTIAPGIQFGYLYQFANEFVSGVEANVTINTHQTETLGCNSIYNPDVYDHFTFKNQMQTSIKGRFGHTLDWNKNTFLPYLTAGGSFANLGLTYQNEGGDYYSTTRTQLGWLIGAGIEWSFMQHWSLRAEYYFVDYGNAINLSIPSIYDLQDPNGKGHINLRTNNVIAAINYWL